MKLIHHLAIDLQGTRSQSRQPDGWLLSRIHRLTGFFDETIEEESLGMLRLMDRTQQALKSADLANIIRLVLDQQVIYDDRKGRENDLEEALNKAAESDLSAIQCVQLVLEHQTENHLHIATVTIHPRHEPGNFPIWIRVATIGQDLLLKPRQQLSTYESKLRKLFSDSDTLERTTRSWEKDTQPWIARIARSLRKHLPVHRMEQSRHVEFGSSKEDYYFAYQKTILRSLDRMQSLAFQFTPQEKSESSSMTDLALASQKALQAMESRLTRSPKTGSHQSNRAHLITWNQFARKQVLNPATGRICRIDNLPIEHQTKYRSLFNAETHDPSEHVPLEIQPGLLERTLGAVGRGLTQTVSATMSTLREKSPNTYSFLKDETYRKKVLTESSQMMGVELFDQADILAHTLVGELIQTAKIPVAHLSSLAQSGSHNIDDDYQERQQNAQEQLFDLMELLAGTVIPFGAWATGGPLGGVVGLAGIKMFQKALNWHSKRIGGREWTIRPSSMIERQEAIREKRSDKKKAVAERIEQERNLAFERLGIETGPDEKTTQNIQNFERELAQSLRDFGQHLQTEGVEFTEEDLSLDSIKEKDLLIALREEAATPAAKKA
ncbi:MAG: hypothetical protein QF752_04170 [Planctomycetota bacterium]|jgi:hypothetical protein|nr:hypothetical protein [Planctomycetota bacterium]